MNNRPKLNAGATIFFLLVPFLNCSGPSFDKSEIAAEIQTILDSQKVAWNRGDLDGFMQYYWNSEDFRFQSGNRRLNGWQGLYSMYRRNYSGQHMGTLDLTDIEIHVLSNDIAYALGRWKVFREESPDEGLFTLLFRRFHEGWRIVCDHSSQGATSPVRTDRTEQQREERSL